MHRYQLDILKLRNCVASTTDVTERRLVRRLNKDLDGIARSLYYSNLLFPRRSRETNGQEPENSTFGLWAVNQICNIPNTKQECQTFNHDAR